MFNPTKSHQKMIDTNQYRLRIGHRVPQDAVNLAYVHAPSLNPKDIVHITDTSRFILENMTSTSRQELLLFPDDSGLLKTKDGVSILSSRRFLLTNVFSNEEPLYFMHQTKYSMVYTKSFDPYEYYMGSAVSIVDRHGQPLSGHYRYQIILKPTQVTHHYDVLIYTNFQVQPNDDIYVIYAASQEDGTTKLGYQEQLNPQPAFSKLSSLQEVVQTQDNHYYLANGKEVGESQLYVPFYPINESSYRTPISFQYRIRMNSTANGVTTVDSTPWLSDSIFHRDCLGDFDKAYRSSGHKQLKEISAKELLDQYVQDLDAKIEQSTDVYFYVESSTHLVEVFTHSDGQGTVLAYTSEHTGDKVPFSVNAYLREERSEGHVVFIPKFSLKTDDNNRIEILSPSEKRNTENWYIRIKSGKFYRHATSVTGLPTTFEYNTPEYFTQNFHPSLGIPYREVKEERPEIIGREKIKVRHAPLYIPSLKLNNILEVYVNGTSVPIKGWNLLEGSIEVGVHVRSTDDIRVNYIYEEKSYTYRGYWDEENQAFMHLDLNPSQGHYYHTIDERTKEISSTPSFQLLNHVVYIYIRPTAIYQQLDDGSKKIITGSYQPQTLFHSFKELKEPHLLLLAKIQVRPSATVNSLTIKDVRVPGGGLKPFVHQSLIEQFGPETKTYWDIGYWDGDPYSENGIVIVRLSERILKNHGGRFEQSEVEQIVRKHLGFGILPIIEYLSEDAEKAESNSVVQTIEL